MTSVGSEYFQVTSLATESPELIEKQAIPVFPKTVTLPSGMIEGQPGNEGGSGRILEHRESRDDKSKAEAEEGSRYEKGFIHRGSEIFPDRGTSMDDHHPPYRTPTMQGIENIRHR